MNVVLFRDQSSISESVKELKPLRVFACPAIEIQPVKLTKSLKSISNRKFDFILVTSANSFRFYSKPPRAKHWVVIGKQTSNTLSKHLKNQRKTVLKESHSGGVLKFFKKARKHTNASIFYPCSHLADRAVVRALQKMGYRVTAKDTYRTKILSIRKPLAQILKKQSPEAFFITSPSTVMALRRSFSRNDLKKMAVHWVAIGPTTAKVLRSQCGIRAFVSPKQTLKSMKTLALKRSTIS